MSTILDVEDPFVRAASRRLVVERGGEPVAGIALAIRRRFGLKLATQRPPESHRLSPGVFWRDRGAIEALVEEVRGMPIDILRLDSLPAASPFLAEVARQTNRAHATTLGPRFALELGQRATFPRRVLRRIARHDARGNRPRRRVVRSPDDLQRHLPDILRLIENARQQEEADPYAVTARGREYLGLVFGALARAGVLTAVLIESEAEPVSCALFARLHDRAVGVRTALDRRQSEVPDAGWRALIAGCEELAQEGVRWIQLGTGGTAHKSRYAAPEPTAVLAMPVSPAGWAAQASWMRGRGLGRRMGLVASRTPSGPTRFIESLSSRAHRQP